MAERGPTMRAKPFLASGTGESVRLLTPEQEKELASLASTVSVPRGRMLYREDTEASAIYFCRDGAVKTYRELPSGVRRISAFLFADDVFGLAESGRYVNSAQAVAATTCDRIPVEALTAALQQDARLQYQFLCKVTHELRESQRRAIIMGRRDAAGRLAMFLNQLRHQLPGRRPPDVVPLPMSRSDIAGYLGHSLEAVSRASAQLTDQGLIAFQGRHAVRVLDPIGLERLAADV